MNPRQVRKVSIVQCHGSTHKVLSSASTPPGDGPTQFRQVLAVFRPCQKQITDRSPQISGKLFVSNIVSTGFDANCVAYCTYSAGLAGIVFDLETIGPSGPNPAENGNALDRCIIDQTATEARNPNRHRSCPQRDMPRKRRMNLVLLSKLTYITRHRDPRRAGGIGAPN